MSFHIFITYEYFNIIYLWIYYQDRVLILRDFFVKLQLYFRKVIISWSFKQLSIVSHYFFPSFWQHADITLEKRLVFWSYQRIDPFFGISKQVVIRRMNVWRIRQVWQDLKFKGIQVGFHRFCNIGSTVDILQNRYLSASTHMNIWSSISSITTQIFFLSSWIDSGASA